MESKLSKKERKNLTSYWGVDLPNPIQCPEINTALQANPDLIPLEKCHSTLLYIGKKVDERDAQFYPYEHKSCSVTVTSFGLNDCSISLKVDSLVLEDNSSVPSYAECQHITYALKKGTPAKDSVKAIQEGTLVTLSTPLVLNGTIKRYLF